MHLRDGRPNGQAFMELETEEDVSKALERHRQYLGPRYIEGLCLIVINLTIIGWKLVFHLIKISYAILSFF